jgi:LacI family transcriptional regulator
MTAHKRKRKVVGPRTRPSTLETSPSAPNKQPTIHDVARSAGVSLATVSNVINARTSQVSERTRKLVQQHIERIGYRPHAAGRGLRTSRRHLVAMVMIDESSNYLGDPFVANLVAGFTDAVNLRGYATVVHGCKRVDLEETVVIKTLGVDGFCLSLSGDVAARRTLYSRLRELKQPLVLAQETDIRPDSDVCVVRQDDFGGGAQLADHLLARGAKRIAVLLPMIEWPAFNARHAGLRAGIERAGRAPHVDIVRAKSETFEHCVAAVQGFLESARRPDAIVAGNDQMAAAAIHAVRSRGLRVPNDVMVTGFNALDFWQYLSPSVTTVRSCPRDIGTTAAQALIERLERGSFAQAQIVLPVVLMPAESTAR